MLGPVQFKNIKFIDNNTMNVPARFAFKWLSNFR